MSRVNSRGIFDIARILRSGSMAEKTSIWKYHIGDHYQEFDFLAVLGKAIYLCEDQSARNNCKGCVEIENPPVELERLSHYYNRENEFNAETLKSKLLVSDLFLNEINVCLTSSCDCLSVQFYKDHDGDYTISFRPSSVEHKFGCDMCTVDMPTGTLHVNTEINIEQHSNGPNNCSLIFQWISKAKSLSAYDDMLLQKSQKITSLPIYVDFLPALESLKPTSSGAGNESDYFIVPKTCNVCGYDYTYRKWRKSCCVAEINAFTTYMSDKHRKCYQIIKYLSVVYVNVPSYHIKTIVLRHQTTCSDTTDDCVDCVMSILWDILQAYENKELFSYHSNLDILKGGGMKAIAFVKDRCKGLIHKLCSVSVTDSWETFIKKMCPVLLDERTSDNNSVTDYWEMMGEFSKAVKLLSIKSST